MKAAVVSTEALLRLSFDLLLQKTASFSHIFPIENEADLLEKSLIEPHLDLILIHRNNDDATALRWHKIAQRLYPQARLFFILDRENTQKSGKESDNSFMSACRKAPVIDLIKQLHALLALPVDQTSAPPRDKALISASTREQALGLSARDENTAPCTTQSCHSSQTIKKLSPRQKDILNAATQGLSNREIANKLQIAEGTVKAHLHIIFKRLGVKNRTQAALLQQTKTLDDAEKTAEHNPAQAVKTNPITALDGAAETPLKTEAAKSIATARTAANFTAKQAVTSLIRYNAMPASGHDFLYV